MLIELVALDQEKSKSAGSADTIVGRTDALLAALKNDRDGIIAGIHFALDKGIRDPLFFRSPVFEPVRSDPDFLELQSRMHLLLEAEKEKALQLVCYHNPIPDTWQPLPETCAGVENNSP